MVWLLMISLLINLLLFGSTAYFFMAQSKVRSFYFASTSDGQLIRMYPLGTPVLTDSAIEGWTSRNIPKLYNLNFVQLRRQVLGLREYFTPFGWSQFTHAFGPELRRIQSSKLIVSATPTNVPVITQHGVFNGVYSWQVQIPVVVSYQAGDTQTTQHVIVRLILQRTNSLASGQIVGISQIVVQDAPPASS